MMDSKGGDFNSDPMEVDSSVQERPCAENVVGESGNVSAEKIKRETDGDASAEEGNRNPAVKIISADASVIKSPVSPLIAAFISGDKEAYKPAVEAEKSETAAQGGEFKVPRFSSRNPPPPPEPEFSSKFKVPPAPANVLTELECPQMDPPGRRRPNRKEIVSDHHPRVFPELSGHVESRSQPDYTDYLEVFAEEKRKGAAEKRRQAEERKRLVENEVNSNATDLATAPEGAVGGPAASEAETEVSGATEGKSAGAVHSDSEWHDGSGNSEAVKSAVGSEGAVSLTAVEPRADVGIPTEGNLPAVGCADSEMLNGDSGAPDLATASESAVAPAPGQPGVADGTASQRKVVAIDRVASGAPPYVKPSWGAAPGHPFKMEILKEGVNLGVEDVSQKGAYMFGRSDRCDFCLEHPTISRFHAVLQYNAKGKAFIFDLGSTHGTFINKQQVQAKTYVPLNVGNIVRFGHSTRLYHFQGPVEFLPQEGLSKAERHAVRILELGQERAEKEQSLLRARRNVASADGATWGMQEDAMDEEEEDDTEEITWQNFKGDLTEKQQKTLEKVHKRQEKLANLKKENDAIQAKEISQGGLTQGQQTQIARNEQRMAQLVEELENMEETLNESIREAVIGRSGTRRGGKKSSLQNEDEDEDLSDDEFYDRTGKEKWKKKEASQVVETAETLLEKKSSFSKEIESVRLLMRAEEEHEDKQKDVVKKDAESVDPLDKFMTTISTSIVQDRAARLQKELGSLTTELERVERLLKIADPTGDSLRKWELKQTPESLTAAADLAYKIDKRIFPRKEDGKELSSSTDGEDDGASNSSAQERTSDSKEDGEKTLDLRPLDPPIRLGAPVTKEETEEKAAELYGRESESATGFINYKDRKKDVDFISKERSTSKGAASGTNERREEEATGVEKNAASSVALLLKHKRGLAEGVTETQETTGAASESSQQRLKKKKIYGPEKPSYMTNAEEEESWVPPAGQNGDGRTALNDKYGY